MATFELDSALALLRRTPAILDAWLRDLPEEWVRADEGAETWSAFDVIGHLVHGERTDWMARLRIVLEHGEARPFDPFDRFAQRAESRGRTTAELLDELARLRAENVASLAALALRPSDLERTGTHPELGQVTVRELLATWVAHDLAHLGQIARVMAKRYAADVGPWRAYLSILRP